MFLNSDELEELTGYSQKAKQQSWLADNGYEFDVRADGMAIVTREQVLQRQCKADRAPEVSPNLAAMDGF